MDRDKLLALTRDFTHAFNRNDLDAVMSYMADDAEYDEFNGRVSRGHADIRAAFTPQFEGRFGRMVFDEEDAFVDAEAGKAMISWTVHLEIDGEPTSWRGLDLLHWRDGQLVRKLTYCKAKAPLFSS